MSNDWRNHWRKSRWVTIADFPLLSLDINPATYEGGHADAGRRGDDLLKQAFASDDERVGIKLRMRTQPGSPQHKARHLVRMSCRPGEYRPDDMDREIFMRDAIAFAVDEGWEVPGWLRSLIVDTPSSVVTPTTSNQFAGQEKTTMRRETQADRVDGWLTECESRAAKKEKTFDRWNMPGKKADFLDLLKRLDADFMGMKSVQSLDRYLNGRCKWSLSANANPDARPLYEQLFPEAFGGQPGAASDIPAHRKKS